MNYLKSSRLFLAAAAALLVGAAAPQANAMQGTPNEGAWLGVYIQDLTPRLREHFSGISDSGGVLISRVLSGSPAEKAGLRAGDVLLELDRAKLDGAEHLRQQVSRSRPETDVALLVQRGDETLNLTAHLEKKPPSIDSEIRAGDETRREIPWSRWFVLDREGGLGAHLADMNAGLSIYMPGSAGKGVLVLEVCSDSPAEKAGLQPGDVIVSAEGNAVADLGDLRHELRQSDDDEARLELIRKGERSSATIELRTASECWNDPDRSFFQMRPGFPSPLLTPESGEATPDQAEPLLPELFNLAPDAISRLLELRANLPTSEDLQKDLQAVEKETAQLQESLKALREEVDALKKSLTSPETQKETEAAPPVDQ